MGDTDPDIDAAELANSDFEESGTEEVNPLQELDSKWEARFAKLESALLGALTNKASQPETSGIPAPAKPATKQDSDTKRVREQSPVCESASDAEETPPAKNRPGASRKGKQPLAKVARTSAESDSDGEIKDDDDDAISVDCEDEDDELLKELASEIDNTEATSEKVAASMADIINKRFSQSLTGKKLKTKLDQNVRPVNCDWLVVPTVNNEVWRNLPPQAKKADLKLAMTQRAILKASVAVAQSTQLVLRAHTKKTLTDKSTKDNITNKTADAFALLGHACNELSLRRRYALKPHLPKNLAGLCSSTVPVTSQLFGDNLSASMKEVKELEKLTQATSSFGQDKRKSYNKQYNRDKPFLGQHNLHQSGHKKPFSFGQQSYHKRKAGTNNNKQNN